MALLIAPLFTAGIAVGGIQNANAGGPVTIVVDADGAVGHSSPRNIAQCDGTRITVDVENNIGEAIGEANPGDTIIVCPHDTIYAESVGINVAGITIKGIAKPTVGGGAAPAFTITADGVHLTGFEAISGDSSCIVINADDVRIHGIITSGCVGNGIVADGERIIISGNNLSGNDNDGLLCGDCIDSVIQGNTANDNGDDGIQLSLGSHDNLVKGNTANGNGDNGIEIRGEDNTISNNDASNNDDDGIHVKGSSDENDVTHNNTNDNTDNGIQNDGTNNTFSQNRCRDNGTGSTPSELCKPQGFA